MVQTVIFSAICTVGAVKRLVQFTRSIGLILISTTLILADMEEFQRIEMRIRELQEEILTLSNCVHSLSVLS